MVGGDRTELLGKLEVAQRLGIWEWTPATNQMAWSDGLYELLDFDPAVEPSLDGMLAKLHPADRRSFENHLSRARRERGLLAFRCRSEGKRVLHVRMQRTLADDGSLRSIVGTNQDITDAQLAADPTTALTAWTDAITHELNNPLAVISAVLQEQPTPATADALRAVDRIRRTLEELALSTRGDRGTMEQVHLEQIAELVIAELRPTLDGETIETALQETAPVQGSPSAIRRVISELMANAIDAVESAVMPLIEVRTYSDHDWSVLEISDRGVGISSAVRARMFEPFFTTKGVGRRGLGLAICRGVVDSLGGSLTIMGNEREGTRALLALPTRPAQPRTTTASRVAAGSETVRGRVLVVDDEVLFASALERLLSREHDVVVAGHGRAAYELIAKGARFDVILCDVMMPEMNGIELHTALLELAKDQAERMIYITGGQINGADPLLREVETFEKPCDVAQLREAVRRRVAAVRKGR